MCAHMRTVRLWLLVMAVRRKEQIQSNWLARTIFFFCSCAIKICWLVASSNNANKNNDKEEICAANIQYALPTQKEDDRRFWRWHMCDMTPKQESGSLLWSVLYRLAEPNSFVVAPAFVRLTFRQHKGTTRLVASTRKVKPELLQYGLLLQIAAEMGVNGDDCSHQTNDGSIYGVQQHHECDKTNTSDGAVLIEESGDAFTIEDADANCSNKGRQSDNHKSIHIAHMINVTYREFWQLMCILSNRAVISWKEMVVDATMVHTIDLDIYFLEYSHPIVCHVGGKDPETLRRATRKALEYGYDEVNLNMGCPSKLIADRNKLGAVLMKQVDTAELALKTMLEDVACFSTVTQRAPSSSSPAPKLSVKCCIGIDHLLDSLDDLIGVLIWRLSNHWNIFYLHACKAVLRGILSPVKNRSIPPLNYLRVYKIC
jgi:hypothetical protein